MGVACVGSSANGLEEKDSVDDLVINRLLKPDTPAGFFGWRRTAAANALHKLRNHLMNIEELGGKDILLIDRAKVLLLKIKMSTGGMLDMSIDNESCCEAAHCVLEKTIQHHRLKNCLLDMNAQRVDKVLLIGHTKVPFPKETTTTGFISASINSKRIRKFFQPNASRISAQGKEH